MADAKTNRRWMALGIALLTVSVVAGLMFSRGARVKSISVSETVYTRTDDVLRVARIETGVDIDSVGYLDAIARIERLPYVKRASMRMSPNGSLGIRIDERQPIAKLVTGGAPVYVDADGVVLPVVPGAEPDVPLVHGFSATRGDTLKSAAFTITRDFLLAAATRTLAGITLGETTYDPREGVVALSQESRVRVLFGKEGFEQRLLHWEAFYGQVVPQKGISRFKSVDLRYRGQIITKESI